MGGDSERVTRWMEDEGPSALAVDMNIIDTDHSGFDDYVRRFFGEENDPYGPSRRVTLQGTPGFTIDCQGRVGSNIQRSAVANRIHPNMIVHKVHPPAEDPAMDVSSHLISLAESGVPYEVTFKAVRLPKEIVEERGTISLRAMRGDISKRAGHRRVYFGNVLKKVVID